MIKNKDKEEKEWEIQIIIPANIDKELNDNKLIRLKFKCKIEENAIIFFKSKYRKQEQETIIQPNKVIDIIRQDRNRKQREKEMIINLNKP